ncbi:MAG: UDP-N-acetylmuramoyl-tripeptide--D-alanyl-D-alanine ligase [Candidatus Competibacteraceae bacterium]|jgi:UDP-N-acetylmuramoyl-tripeptide--D-alanyl-D-alanine ligase|nr:UDP-N-acetylmuramoyl-tripeptide--D-alanyl-D-alanine ligase [Candidatus Competibacteraceae bacterium]
MINSLALLSASCGVLLFFHRRVLTYLRYFQQEEYNGQRFLAWFWRYRAFDRRGSVICLLTLLVTGGLTVIAPTSLTLLGWLLGAGALAWIAWREDDPRKTGKVTLKITQRARRIWYTASGLFLGVVLVMTILWWLTVSNGYLPFYWLIVLLLIQCSPFLLILANRILAPYERGIQQSFRAEACTVLAKVDPTVIGITGSYGKTSTKTILGALLDTVAPTFWSPGSINTEMGLVREIRERLKTGYRFAIIEMGAYGIGSIRKLCNLTPPQVGVITYVGVMHLERFGSQEAIYQAKSELAQAVPESGILVCNGDNPGARRMAAEYPKARTLLYGLNPEDAQLDCWMSDIAITVAGTQFVIHWDGQAYPGTTPLLGQPMLSNLLAAFTTACALGAHPTALIAATRNLSPPAHRLELRQQYGALVIDDSYNSNPVGFAEALAILGQLPGRRKLLITPGMIELGELQESENRRLATLAATVCDLVLVVGETNAKAFAEGLQAGGAGADRAQFFPHRESARAYLEKTVAEGDVILWENDLPDIYEDQPSF